MKKYSYCKALCSHTILAVCSMELHVYTTPVLFSSLWIRPWDSKSLRKGSEFPGKAPELRINSLIFPPCPPNCRSMSGIRNACLLESPPRLVALHCPPGFAPSHPTYWAELEPGATPSFAVRPKRFFAFFALPIYASLSPRLHSPRSWFELRSFSLFGYCVLCENADGIFHPDTGAYLQFWYRFQLVTAKRLMELFLHYDNR